MEFADLEAVVLISMSSFWLIYFIVLTCKIEKPNTYNRAVAAVSCSCCDRPATTQVTAYNTETDSRPSPPGGTGATTPAGTGTGTGGGMPVVILRNNNSSSPNSAVSDAPPVAAERSDLPYYARRCVLWVTVVLIVNGVDAFGARGVYPTVWFVWLACNIIFAYLTTASIWIGFTARALYRQLNHTNIPDWLYRTLVALPLLYFGSVSIVLASLTKTVAIPIAVLINLSFSFGMLFVFHIVAGRLWFELQSFITGASASVAHAVIDTSYITRALRRLFCQFLILDILLLSAIGAAIPHTIADLKHPENSTFDARARRTGPNLDSVSLYMFYILPVLYLSLGAVPAPYRARTGVCSCLSGPGAGDATTIVSIVGSGGGGAGGVAGGGGAGSGGSVALSKNNLTGGLQVAGTGSRVAYGTLNGPGGGSR